MTMRPPRSNWWHHGHVGTHESYGLSCTEFDDLVIRSEGRCDRCNRPTPDLYIEHDHNHQYGRRAVRGMACPKCNQVIAVVDRGLKPADPLTTAYFSKPFHVQIPAQRARKTGWLAIQLPDGCRQEVLTILREAGWTLTEFVTAALRRFARDPQGTFDSLRDYWPDLEPMGRPRSDKA